MQIVIPMSGFGERFRKAGYGVPKPLIEVDGKPIIEHVVDLFPGETGFTFIVNEDHLANPEFLLEETLSRIAPECRIVPIKAHKLGPINAVLKAMEHIKLDEPVLVNYCDFTCLWDWVKFKEFVASNALDGAIPAYKGFHPHSLGDTNYAYIREDAGRFLDIQEKQPFTANRMNEYASSGTYYFGTGQLMREAFEWVIQNDVQISGEYYVSNAYKFLAESKLKTYVYPIKHFMQWGTPQDLKEYQSWSKVFSTLASASVVDAGAEGNLIMPMAGLGQRFKNEGYRIAKPLIEVSGAPMVIQAAGSLPTTKHQVFILRKDLDDLNDVSASLAEAFPNSDLEILESVTDGQARTVALGLQQVYDGEPTSQLVGACDNGVLFDKAKYKTLLDSPQTEVIVWVARGHVNAIRKPEMFGWVKQFKGQVTGVSVKQPLENPETDPIVIGTMTFKNQTILRLCLDRLFARDGKINGEYYLDSVVEDALDMGLNVEMFEVDSFISWGTPDDLRTFEYWQSCFHLWDSHPYSVVRDSWVPQEKKSALGSSLLDFSPRIDSGKLFEN